MVPGLFDEYSASIIKKRNWQQMTRVTRMCHVCAIQAMENSGIDLARLDPARCGVVIGAVSACNTSVEHDNAPRNRIIKSMSNAMPAWISMRYKINGPAFTVNTACASSAYAIALGYDMISNGSCDLVIAGGADSAINPEEIEGFNELFALSVSNDDPARACRPFAMDRDGFVMGEGAGILILESEKSAFSRRANIYAELAGHGCTSEAYNIMSPVPDGSGMSVCMDLALKKAGIKPSEVDYICAHGTGTTLNDLSETLAIKKVFADHAANVSVSSPKSMIGHTIAAAGAIEAAICVMSMNSGVLVPTINLLNPDPDLDLDYVPNKARHKKIRVAISNSFAFGGHNSTLVLKQY
jgi:3-oxoacyl-[acyl-carrier-protein] synthase II